MMGDAAPSRPKSLGMITSFHRPSMRSKVGFLSVRVIQGYFLVEPDPAISISTRRRALCSQPGRAAVWKMPTSARTKSLGSVSARRSPLAMARWSLRSGATGMDVVVHLAFSHDWSTVRGLTRSYAGVEQLKAAGAEVTPAISVCT
jgi:hypothetical protein